ncbi:uncharacterized protein LOC121997413 [Zingiber officinale]|uniref:uncharacterized protein LOC121997413 n=1 Tax=Zingiber officinale TaxID=94328 RepID=UPI001C4C03AE|nr:uncharacterized protein LOC121997413 [Zingiber officinale]
MRCARHPFEDGIGVCATCLRERLLVLVASVAGGTSPFASPSPAPLFFRRSASPRVPAASEKLKSAKPSILTSLFGRGLERKPRRSSSWISALLHGGRPEKIKNTSRPFSSTSNRGMSPENRREPPLPRQSNISPTRSATAEHHRHCHSSGLSGFAICFSPLATANHPNNNRRTRVSEFGFSGELQRAAAEVQRRPRRQLRRATATAPALGHDRSRKLVDLGKFS